MKKWQINEITYYSNALAFVTRRLNGYRQKCDSISIRQSPPQFDTCTLVSVTSTSRFRNPLKVDPLCTAEVDSTELADVRADCSISCDILSEIVTLTSVITPHIVG